MNIAFHTGVSGMTAYQEGLNLISNNIANVNTDGFKASKESFRNLVNTNMDVHEREKLMYGHGIKAMGGDLIMREGNFRQSSSPLDFAIVGDGFFGVLNGDNIQYSRNGAMTISVEEEGNFLVTYDGDYVLDGDGQKITIPYKAAEEDEEGGAQDEEEGENMTIDFAALNDMIGIYKFANPHGLIQNDGLKFSASTTSGAAYALVDEERATVDLLSNMLEASNVDLADEMVAVMQTQKAYQFTAKIVQTADQIEEIVNNLR